MCAEHDVRIFGAENSVDEGSCVYVGHAGNVRLIENEASEREEKLSLGPDDGELVDHLPSTRHAEVGFVLLTWEDARHGVIRIGKAWPSGEPILDVLNGRKGALLHEQARLDPQAMGRGTSGVPQMHGELKLRAKLINLKTMQAEAVNTYPRSLIGNE